MSRKVGYTAFLLAATVLVFGLTGCPPQPKAHVAVLLSGDLGDSSKMISDKAADVGLDEIQSLVVTLTEISLDSSNNPEDDGNDGTGANSKLVVFSGAVDIDLRDLIGVSELISTAEVPAGAYTKIRLSIENPRMTLVAQPDEVITDIQTTANGRLFVSSTFDVPADQDSLILLDFQGLHLVETGNGKYVWTPQLRTEISVEPADVQLQGRIDSVDADAGTLTLVPASGAEPVLVHYTGAAIYLAADTDTPSGTEADLVVDAQVTIVGKLTVTGEANAESIWIQ